MSFFEVVGVVATGSIAIIGALRAIFWIGTTYDKWREYSAGEGHRIANEKLKAELAEARAELEALKTGQAYR